jgi:hypothetical protein
MTRHTQHLASIATIAAAALALSACDSAGSETPTVTASTSTSAASDSPTATSTPTPTASPEEVAIAAAEKKIPEYFAVADRSLQDPDTFKLDDLKKVAISSALVDMENRFSVFHRPDVDADGRRPRLSPSRTRASICSSTWRSHRQMSLRCSSMSVSMSASSTWSMRPGSRNPSDPQAPRQLWRVGVANYEYPSPDDWRVSFTDTQGGKTC